MTQMNSTIIPGKTVYPLTVSLTLILVAVILSFVDLAFLNEVIGKVLDIGAAGSMLISFALGLIGIAIMAHQGVKEAHGGEKTISAAGHLTLWVFLGLAFVMIRLFSATILQLDSTSGDGLLIKIMGLNIRQVDLVLAPLMLFLYLTTGFMVKDGVNKLLLNSEYEDWLVARKKAKEEKKNKDNERSTKAEKKIAKLQADAERRQQQRMNEMEANRVKSALNGTYSNALIQYRAKEKEIKEKYQKISANIDFIKSIDKQEKDFNTKVKPSLLQIVQESIYSIQNSTALAIRKKTGEDATNLLGAIESYNKVHHDQNN